MPGTFDVDVSQLRNVQGRFARANQGLVTALESELHRLGRVATRTLKDEAPGTRLPTRISYRIERTSRQSWKLDVGVRGYDPDVLKYILRGTRPHTIVAVRARALHFYWEKVGREVYFRRVFHPGTKANPFIMRAIISLQRRGEFDALRRRVGKLVIQGIAV